MKKIKLDDISKKPPFEVPEGYFDQLMIDIQDKVAQKEKKKWIAIPQVKWALAGSFTALVVLILVLLPQGSSANAEQMLAEVSDEELMEYLDLNSISEYELIEGMDIEEVDALWGTDSFENLDLGESDLDELITDYEIDNLL